MHYKQQLEYYVPVSYTHLDVYKRQLSALTYSYNNAMESIDHKNGDYKDFTSEIGKNNTYILVRLDTFDSEKAAEKYADSMLVNEE